MPIFIFMKLKFAYSLLYCFSLIPFRVMFVFSDIIFVILYYIIGYRKNVVRENLKTAFPEKTDSERNLIMTKFYKNFCDWIFETIKLCSISQKELDKRMEFNQEKFNSYADGKNSMILALGHLFNWEFAAHKVHRFQNQPVCINYLPLSNKLVNENLNKIRSRRGAIMISAIRFSREFMTYARHKHTLILIADQRPQSADNGWWVNFFSKPTIFFQGPGKMANMMNSSLVFISIQKIKRGYYSAHTHLITRNASELSPQEITTMYVRKLEETICRQPENYMWTHKKWKWNFEEKYQHLKID